METREELERQIQMLRDANKALLEGHAHITSSWLALRLSKLEDRFERFSNKVSEQLVKLNRRLDDGALAWKDLDRRVREVNDE